MAQPKMECSDCGRDDFRSAAGLASHRRQKHREPSRETGPNERALEETLAALREQERIGASDSAKTQIVRSLAQQVDSGQGSAALWREYWEALDRLTADDDHHDEVEAALERLRAPVGDAAEV